MGFFFSGCTTVEDAWTLFVNLLNDVAARCIPSRPRYNKNSSSKKKSDKYF